MFLIPIKKGDVYTKKEKKGPAGQMFMSIHQKSRNGASIPAVYAFQIDL